MSAIFHWDKLSLPDPVILKMKEEDNSDNSEVFKLGGELEAAQDFYLDIHYCKKVVYTHLMFPKFSFSSDS